MIFNQKNGSTGGGGGDISLSFITIIAPPAKTAYLAGERFDPIDMVVQATYSNGATLIVGGYTVSPQILTAGTEYVTITYTEGGVSRTATQEVTVSKRTPVLTVTPSSVTLNADTPTAALFVDTDSDGAISVSSSDESVATASVEGKIVTVSSVDEVFGAAMLTVSAEETAIYEAGSTAVEVTAWFIPAFEDATPEQISLVGATGSGAQYWDIGDMTPVKLSGTIGITTDDKTMHAFIAHFNYMGQNGVYLMGFMDKDTGKVLGLCDGATSPNTTNGTKTFNLNHWGQTTNPSNTNYGGWKGCDLRYDIFGSTNKAPSGYGKTATTSRTGYDPDDYDIVNSPVQNTFASALPIEWRRVIKPFTVYTDNKGNKSTAASAVTASLDYFVLPAEFEVFGTTPPIIANANEPAKQEQLKYYELGNSTITYDDRDSVTAKRRWCRSPYAASAGSFARVTDDGSIEGSFSYPSNALTPLWRVA